MPIKVIDTIKPNGIPLGQSQFPTVEDIDILGGYQVVGTDIARNNIPSVNRKQGMLVYVVADQLFYQLGSDLVTWSVANFASDTTLAGDVTGQGSANTVTKIRGTTVSTNSVSNDGYALVSTSGTYIPTGISPTINVKNFGAKGDGTTDDHLAIVSADVFAATLSNRGAELVFPPGTYRISGNILTSQGIKYHFQPGATLLVDSGHTFTFQSEVEAASTAQVFSSTQLAGGIAWTAGIQPKVYIDWWGSDGFAVQRACDSAHAASIQVHAHAKSYTVGASSNPAPGLVLSNSNATIIGLGQSDIGSNGDRFLTQFHYVGSGRVGVDVGVFPTDRYGTSPPQISVSGNATISGELEISITNATGPIFSWSINGSGGATGVSGSGTVVLGSTGISVNLNAFSGIFHIDNVYKISVAPYGSSGLTNSNFIANIYIKNLLISTPTTTSKAIRLWFPVSSTLEGIVAYGPESDGTLTYPATDGYVPDPIAGHTGVVCHVQNAVNVTIDRCRFNGSNNNVFIPPVITSGTCLYIGSANGVGSTTVSVRDTYLNAGYQGAYIETSNGISFDRCVFEINMTGYEVIASSSASFRSCWFEGNGSDPAAQSSVSGTTPPIVTVTGVPNLSVGTVIELDVTNATGPVYTWKINGVSQGSLTGTQALGLTGLTANFPSGTYHIDNVYTFTTGPTNPNSVPAGAPYVTTGSVRSGCEALLTDCFISMYNSFATILHECEANGKLVSTNIKARAAQNILGNLVLFDGYVENAGNHYVSIINPLLPDGLSHWLTIPKALQLTTGDIGSSWKTIRWPIIRTRTYTFVYKNVTANLSAVQVPRQDGSGVNFNFSLPEPGYVLGMDFSYAGSITTSTYEVFGQVNGGTVLDSGLIGSGAPDGAGSVDINLLDVTFNAHDNLGVKLTTGATFANTGNDLVVQLTVAFCPDPTKAS